MTRSSSLAAALTLSLAALGAAPTSAAAGSLDGAQLACFVDTYAFDYLVPEACVAVWIPNGADIESVAYFEVIGLPPGSYSFQWNLPSCGASYCTAPIRAWPETTVDASVTITDLSTYQQRTVSATALYLNGYY